MDKGAVMSTGNRLTEGNLDADLDRFYGTVIELCPWGHRMRWDKDEYNYVCDKCDQIEQEIQEALDAV
jgi:hypothetical protein